MKKKSMRHHHIELVKLEGKFATAVKKLKTNKQYKLKYGVKSDKVINI